MTTVASNPKIEQILQFLKEAILDEAAARRALINLGQSEAEIETLLVGTGNIAVQDSTMEAGDGSVVASSAGRDIVSGTLVTVEAGGTVIVDGTPAPASLDPTVALDRYLGHVIEANRRLQLQGIRSAGELVSIELEQVYITLTATTRRRVAASDADWLADSAKLAPGEGQRRVEAGGDGLTAVPVQQALAQNPRLVVLGDPGCGKTTLLRYLALTYARALAGESDLVQQRLNLDEQRLPILLPLRDFARHLAAQHADSGLDGPALLVDYLRAYFANQGIALPKGFFARWLERGGCAVLLDGVDEVADLPTRYRIARLIERFTIAYPENRYVVTSRLVGYTDSAKLGVEYVTTRVRDFSQADIGNFISHWNLAVELTLARADTPEARRLARRQTESLLAAIATNERVRELAVNPLLLTVVALVQRYRAQLPERRTELYEEAIEVLLGQWDVGKGLTDTATVAGRVLDAGDRRSMLEPIALKMMEDKKREIEAGELRQELGRQFQEMTGDKRKAERGVTEFLRVINERSGLLTERGHGIYSFSHLTFQEHLAARAVAARADYIGYSLKRLGESWWREVILLEAGYLSTQGQGRVSPLIEAIMGHEPEGEGYHHLILAAECLRDVGPGRVGGGLWQTVQKRLRREFEQPLEKPKKRTVWQNLLGRAPVSLAELIKRRAEAAEALGRIESGGSGLKPAFWRQPDGEPVWITIPAGEFWLGGDGESDGKPMQRLYLPEYRIARTPITNAQYQLFVEAAKHRAPSHWDSGRPPKGKESHPVVSVDWHDALAYCAWLSERTGKKITLPSEAEWEKAARGDKDQRAYPWGEKWDATKCNNKDLGLGETTPVGIFPEGASAYGCLDMAGNVWEWTRSEGKDYPYDSNDGREDPKRTDVPRVLRGGSFHSSVGDVRCAYRSGWYAPDFRYYYYGFRVVCGAPILTSVP